MAYSRQAMLCTERILLGERYHVAVNAYLTAIEGMRDINSPWQALQEAFERRFACDEAMLEWQTHIQAHGCGDTVAGGLNAASPALTHEAGVGSLHQGRVKGSK